MLKKALLAVVCLVAFETEARMTSYAGGSTVMLKVESMRETVYAHYTPNYKYSIGVEGVNDKITGEEYAYLRFNYLLDRKNTNISQRNLHFQTGVSNDGLDNFFYGLHGDWETRRWFVAFEAKRTETSERNINEFSGSLGVAPYIGDYGDLHTWVLAKTKRNSVSDKWEFFPVLKLFKGNAFLELGYGTRSNWDIHLMYQF